MAKPDALWPHVHLLTVLAQTGSFTQTAQRLALSKAAVSQRLSELERAVGVPLVRRTTRSVRLTDAGRQLADETARSSRSRRASAACAIWPASRAAWCA
jgi:DNA-binding transcriptional LysR family regulator